MGSQMQGGWKSVSHFQFRDGAGKTASISFVSVENIIADAVRPAISATRFGKILPAILRLQFYVEVSGPFLI
jgi:hypothetical protein